MNETDHDRDSEPNDQSQGEKVPNEEEPRETETTEAPSEKEANNPSAEKRFPVLAIGASAGGLEALQELLGAMPADTGMAFVIITHQHPDHTSLLPELLGRCTEMPVMEARDNLSLASDHVYVAPPGGYMALKDATLHLMEGPKGEIPPLPIDYFFRALAEDQEDHAICIVLSGTGADGTLGLKSIKGNSGMAIVQEAQSASYNGMPSNAIATGLADYVLRPDAMPSQLVAYARSMAFLPSTGGEEPEASSQLDQFLQKIFILIRSRTGHDFSSYKRSTMRRRIERRMNVHQIQNAEHYVRLLQENPQEVDVLFKELLIGVTNFFRDPEAFRALNDNILPDLMASRPEGSSFRVWVPGCGTGEEAYTLAILLHECMQKLGKSLDLQVFGTDLDTEAIQVARSGRYPVGIAADVPPDYLQRYFSEEDGIYTVNKQIREMLIFAPQNVISDPPFTKLDLLCCRNLLIYLNTDLQKRLLPVFHYALNAEGVLMLGTSESIDGLTDLFDTQDKKYKIFKRKEVTTANGLPVTPAQPPPKEQQGTPPAGFAPAPKRSHISTQLEKFLLNQFVPPSVVINERGDVIYIHGRTGAYLEPPSGQPNFNIYEMAREGLQVQLTAAIREVLSQEHDVVRQHVPVKGNTEHPYVDLSVARITEPEALRGLLLVSFRPTPTSPAQEKPAEQSEKYVGGDASSEYVQELERELQHTKESLQSTVEELETSNEELKSTNEELQSTNEELQSSNEELETSKEETQSLNEELTTVNAELESKVEELSRANNDMQNLLDSTDIATIFLDNDLKIQRYTEQATDIVNVIPTDVERPLTDLGTNLRYEHLVEDAREVLRTLNRKEKEVETAEGWWYLMRIMPYRVRENVIEGVVITFVDISASKTTAAAEQNLRELLESVFNTFSQPAMILDQDLRVIKANAAFYRDFHTNTKKTEDQLIYDVGGGEWDIPELRELLEGIITKQTSIENYEVSGRFPKIGDRIFRLNARRLERNTGLQGRILLTMEDVTGDK